jgi:hypothetical protein
LEAVASPASSSSGSAASVACAFRREDEGAAPGMDEGEALNEAVPSVASGGASVEDAGGGAGSSAGGGALSGSSGAGAGEFTG